MSEESLKPARPVTTTGKPEYAPRLPWKLIGGVFVLIAGVVAFFLWRQTSEVRELREELRSAYQDGVGAFTTEYREARTRVESWVISAARAGEPPAQINDGFSLDALEEGQVLYLRLDEDDARHAGGIEAGARGMTSDAISRCLRVNSVISARGLYQDGAFLMESFLVEVEGSGEPRRLRILRDDLKLRVERDLPNLQNALESDYLLLVIDRATEAEGKTVDAYVFDLDSGDQLLSTRAEANGVLVPARIALPGVEVQRARLIGGETDLANDCAIAAQIRELGGEPATSFESPIVPPPRPSVPSEDSESAGESDGDSSDESASGESASGESASEEAAAGNSAGAESSGEAGSLE
ncbi:MAG: hypothetical protein AAGF12_13570 [Myxococcota bacterium]